MKRIIVSLLLMLSLAAAGWAALAPDPSSLACGARSLGLGKASIAVSGDINAIYGNPAGLASIAKWQVTSMSGKMLDEFNYLNLAGVYPTEYGNLGIAFVGSNIGNDYASKIKEGTLADPIYEYDYSKAPLTYFNNLAIVSYARTLDLPIKVDLGANLKFFSAGISGADVSNANGSGNELDLGVQAKPAKFLTVGLAAKNLLPASMGGKLAYADSHEESYPVEIGAGFGLNILGDQNALKSFQGQKVDLFFDVSSRPTRSNYPALGRVGVEWTPTSLISLRMGMDQDATENEDGSIITVNNLTAGVGVTYKNFRFDYGYHQFAGAAGVDNSFFSITYGIPFEAPKSAPMVVVKPQDKSIVKTATVEVAGQTESSVRFVTVNGQNASVQKDNTFKQDQALQVGKNKLKVEALDIRKQSLQKVGIRMCRLVTFSDVADSHWAADQISYIGTLGIVQGYPNGNFKPEGSITRAELATLLVRTKKINDEVKTSLFKDLKVSHWAAPYILNAAKYNIVKGYPDKTFRPAGKVTRAEGLVMIARFAGVNESEYENLFPDINSSHWAAKTISGAHKAGMLKFLERKMFEPGKSLTRAEAVEMLYRTGSVQDMINKDLLNWESY